MAFPSSPTVGQTTTESGRTYVYMGSKVWNLVSTVAGHAATHSAGAADAITIQTSQISDLAAGANAAARMYLWQTFR